MDLEERAAGAGAMLRRIADDFPPAVMASSFGAEDMVLIDLIARHAPSLGVFTLDTGRLPGETYALIDRTRERYELRIEVYYPDAVSLQRYVVDHGVNAFYRGVHLREECCAIRKTEPLARALAGKQAWVTGLRRSQSITRGAIEREAFDPVHRQMKFNPLIDWSNDEVWAYIRRHGVPYNPLHDRGYPSISCAPCTRAVEPGEDIRAGRWWWEQAEQKECGLHRRPLDVVVRAAAPELAS